MSSVSAVEKKAGASNEKRRWERRGEPASIFLNASAHFQENYLSCQNVQLEEGFTRPPRLFDSALDKPRD